MDFLRNLQAEFIAGTLHEQDDKLRTSIRRNHLQKQQYLQIYRNNMFNSMHEALCIHFPVLQKLLGVEYFKQVSYRYIKTHPPSCGNIQLFGANLSSFLYTHESHADYPYLADVAELEWALQKISQAKDSPLLDIQRLQQVPTEKYADLMFYLNPAVALLQSKFPILEIWQANQDQATDTIIELNKGGVFLMVQRVGLHVEFFELTAAAYVFLSAMAQGATLEKAIAQTQAIAALDIQALLQQWIKQKAIINFNVSTMDVI